MKKLNVLQFICSTGFYGAERWILALANNLDPNQVRSDLAVTVESADQNLEIINYFPGGDGRAFKVEMSGRFDFGVVTKLSALIKERDIDIIHTHGYKSDILGLLAAKRAGIKCVSTPHGFGEIDDLKLKLFVKAGCFALKFFDKVVPLSQQLMSDVKAFGVPEKITHYIQNAVDLKEVDVYWEKRQQQQKSESVKKIGFVGRMVEGKRVDHILDVFGSMWEKDQNIELELLGDGPEREGLEQKAKQMPCASAINFLGFRQDRLDRMLNFDLFVMTSVSEGIPRCLMEAIAMGIPVSAYNITGVDQLVEHEKTGLLAEFGDKKTIESYWRSLLDDEALARELTQNGRDFILDNFSSARMAREYYQLFVDMMSDGE